MTSQAIRLLLAEDNRVDVELAMRVLRRAGLQVTYKVAEGEELFVRALDEFQPHVILSDFSMPNFSGMAALRIAKQRAPGTPFIFVSGTIVDEHAKDAIRAGATAYVLKENVAQLPAAILDALRRT